MFINNKYTKIYFTLVSVNDVSGYTEKHHIIPKCMGGADSLENIAVLSARKHYLCHLLLTKMVKIGSPEYYKLLNAFIMMHTMSKCNERRYINSKIFALYRERFSKLMSYKQKGEHNNQFGKCWVYCPYTLKSKMIKSEQLSFYLNKGCEKGRIANPKTFKERHIKKDIKNNDNTRKIPKIKMYKPIKVEVYCPYTYVSKKVCEFNVSMYIDKGCEQGSVFQYKEKLAQYMKNGRRHQHRLLLEKLFLLYVNNRVSLGEVHKQYHKNIATMIYHFKEMGKSKGINIDQIIKERNFVNNNWRRVE